MGAEFQVRVVPEKHWPDDETLGFCNLEQNTVIIFGGLPDIEKQQVFCHELVHAILHKMAEYELNDNEKFVDMFGSLLHQAWTSIR